MSGGGLVIDGKVELVAGLEIFNWHDNPKLRLGDEDGRRRVDRWIRSIVLHTTKGDEPQRVRAYVGPAGLAYRTVAAWGNDSRHAGAHVIIDGDGTIWCLADLVRDVTYHATSLNEVSIGIELAQSSALEIYQSQIDALVTLDDWLTLRFGIARQLQWPYLGEDHPVGRLAAGGRDCVGIFGHRDQTEDRGPGDPGNAVYLAHLDRSYEGWDFEHGEDLRINALRQRLANQRGAGLKVDGIPGPATVAAIRRLFPDKPAGLWVVRPGDAEAMTAA